MKSIATMTFSGLVLLAVATTTQAGLVNGSFETPTLAGGGSLQLLDTLGTYSWITQTDGTFPIAAIERAPGDMSAASDGLNFAFLDVRGTSNFLLQDNLAVIDENATYDLTLDVAQLIATNFVTSYTVSLTKDGVTAASFTSSTSPGIDTWGPAAVNYSPLAGDGGKALGVRIDAIGGTNSYLGVDNVSVITTLGSLGDFDGSGSVTLADYGILKANWLTTNNAFNTNGEVTNDGIVDGSDFRVFKETLFPGGASALASAIPEPGSMILLLTAAPAWLLLRSSRRKGNEVMG